MNKHVFTATISLAFFLLAVSFYPYIISLTNAWNSEEYSHGYLLPFIAALIGWHKLTEEKPLLNKPSWIGFIVLLGGFLLLTVSQFSAFEPPAHYGFLLCITGILMSFYGYQFTKTLSPALIYLIFCIPLPRLIKVALSAELQLISSTVGVYMLQFIGVPVFQEGNIIDLGYQKLQVVEACSGLRYLFPLMSLGFLMALLLEDKMWKRLFIFLSTIPITVFMNSFRIAWVGILVNWKGPEMAEGIAHDLQGFTVFAVCLAVLFAETWVLVRIGKNKGRIKFHYIGFASGSLGKERPVLRATGIAAALICLVFSSVQLSGMIEKREQNIPQRTAFLNFPSKIGNWYGRREFLDKEILGTLKLTDYLSSNYALEGSLTPVNLYIAYYEKQGIGSSIHSPANCIPGGGWKIVEKEIIEVPLKTISLPVSRMIIEKGNNKNLVYYWFSQRGRTLNNQYEAKFYLLVDSIIKNRTDGALIRLTTPFFNDETKILADQKIKAFIKEMNPLIESYVPN